MPDSTCFDRIRKVGWLITALIFIGGRAVAGLVIYSRQDLTKVGT